MILNENGDIVDKVWKSIPKHYSVKLDAFQVMPNHVHGVLVLNKSVGVSFMKPDKHDQINKIKETMKSHLHMGLINQTPTLGHIVRYFKAKCSYELHKSGINRTIWQRNYHDRVVRNKKELHKIRRYVDLNPIKWDLDTDNPINRK